MIVKGGCSFIFYNYGNDNSLKPSSQFRYICICLPDSELVKVFILSEDHINYVVIDQNQSSIVLARPEFVESLSHVSR